MNYIINAQLTDGNWLNIERPVTSDINIALFRAKEYARQPDILEAEIWTTSDNLIQIFRHE